MKVKTSITLSEDILHAVDKHAKPGRTRSQFIEDAVRAFIRQLERDALSARDLEIINRKSRRLNREAADVLDYQVEW